MSIREKGYHNWNGHLTIGTNHWLPIIRFTIKQIYNKRFSKALFAINLIPFLVFLVFSYVLYVANRPDMAFVAFLKEIPAEVKSLEYFFYTYYCFGPTIFFQYIILSLFCGSDLISADLRSNALPLYFSKPLSQVEYIWGKFLSLLFYLLIFSFLPALILLFIKIAFSGFQGISLQLLLGIFGYPLLAGTTMSLLVLWVSSLSANSRWVKSLFFILLFGLPALGGTLKGISGGDARFMLLDITTNLVQTGNFFFTIKTESPMDPWLSASILFLLSLTLYFLILRKLKRIEV
jgi:ABC-2 type transport system permease protein